MSILDRKIILRYIIRPWYFAGFATFLCGVMAVLFVIRHKEYRSDLKNIRIEENYMTHKLYEQITGSSKERKMKITTFYGYIMTDYGNKYRKGKDRKGQRKTQGLHPKYQKPQVIDAMYNYEQWLDIPHFTLIILAMIESVFNPIAVTYDDEGNIIEAGLWQNRLEFVGQAMLALKDLTQINPRLAKKLNFKFSSMKDLSDPVNATKIEALVVWHYKRYFANNTPYYILATHWGLHRAYKYYITDFEIPDEIVFLKKNLKNDVRKPLHFWRMFYSAYKNFSSFRIEIGYDITYIISYKEKCSRLEYEFVHSWKEEKKLKAEIADLKKYKIEIDQKLKEKINKIIKREKKLDQLYRKYFNMIETGKFHKIKDVWIMWKTHLKQVYMELFGEKIKKEKRVTYIIYFSMISVIFLFTLFGFIMSIWITIKKIRKYGGNNGKENIEKSL